MWCLHRKSIHFQLVSGILLFYPSECFPSDFGVNSPNSPMLMSHNWSNCYKVKSQKLLNLFKKIRWVLQIELKRLHFERAKFDFFMWSVAVFECAVFRQKINCDVFLRYCGCVAHLQPSHGPALFSFCIWFAYLIFVMFACLIVTVQGGGALCQGCAQVFTQKINCDVFFRCCRKSYWFRLDYISNMF